MLHNRFSTHMPLIHFIFDDRQYRLKADFANAAARSRGASIAVSEEYDEVGAFSQANMILPNSSNNYLGLSTAQS
jgi:hypothetical protein